MRRLFGISSALSLLVFLAVLALWLHSYRTCDVLVKPRGVSDHWLVSSEFGLIVIEREAEQHSAIPAGWVYFDSPLPRRFRRSSPAGFAAWRSSVRHYLLLPPTRLWGISLPHSSLAVTFAILPAAWVAARGRERLKTERERCGL